MVWRLEAGRQPVLEFAGRTRRQDGQARVALPDRPSRFVGLGQHRAADAWRDHRGRQAHPRRDAGEQGGVSLRARSDNGRPVWPIEERPVPQSTVPGERSSPTQPFPTKPPAFDLQGISDDDLIDYTPALKERARTIAKQYVMGPVFSPPSVPGENGKKGTLVQPGAWGSANWNTGAFDPDTGFYYAISQTLGPANRTARRQTEIRAPRWIRRIRAGPWTDRSAGVTVAAVDGGRHQHRRPANHQGSLRSNHGDRSQSRRPCLDAAQRRRAAISSVVEGSQPASARLSEPSGAAPHQDTAFLAKAATPSAEPPAPTGHGERSSAPTTKRRAA